MDNLLDESFYIKPLLTPEGHLMLGYLLGAWLAFRDAHDIDDTNLDYSSKHLFEALADYEAIMMRK